LRCDGVLLSLPPVFTTTHVGTEELLLIAFAILSFFASGLFLAIFFTFSSYSSERYFSFSFLSLELLQEPFQLLIGDPIFELT
jgi:hypothetical protein